MGRPKKGVTVEQRFWANVRKTDGNGCWEWTGWLSGFGYAGFYDGKTRLAHRWLYERLNGPIPAGIMLCHKCDNRICVRPDHMFLGTAADNARDMVNKGRGRGGDSSGEKNGSAKLTYAAVAQIKESRRAGISARELATRFGVSPFTIWRVLDGSRWARGRLGK